MLQLLKAIMYVVVIISSEAQTPILQETKLRNWWSQFVHDTIEDVNSQRWVSLFANELKYCLKLIKNPYMDATRCSDKTIKDMLYVLVPNEEQVSLAIALFEEKKLIK